MIRTRRFVMPLMAALMGAAPMIVYGESSTDSPEAVEFFEKKIRPLLADNCFTCHSANTKTAGGLRVDDHKGLLNGGGRGAAIVPGDPENSLLIQAVRHTDDLKMPPGKHLTEEQITDLAKWVADGAVWPKVALPTDIGQYAEEYAQLRNEHWAWQALTTPAVPAVQNTAWPRSEIDGFVLAKLEEKGVAAVADADKLTLIRRVTFDLTGLPPTPAEIDAFLNDQSSNAFEQVVDRLLESQAFGERWGRHWLDVARYAESTGSSRNVPYPHAWRYRDYVIDAFNNDKPFNQFIREQVAGDLLPADSEDQRAEQTVATGFLALGVKDVNQRFKVRFEMDNVDEQIDTVTRSVLGLTASCARCHDHKFDPIPTSDYYALAGIFTSTDLCAGVRSRMGGGGLDYYDTNRVLPIGEAKEISPDITEELEAAKQAVAKAKAEFDRIRRTPEGDEKAPNGRPKRQVARQKFNKAQQALLKLTDPAVLGDVAHGVRDSEKVSDTEIRVRGEAEQLGPVVPRGFLQVVAFPDQPQVNVEQSGRLELAEWLTSDRNPLTQRVAVNRIWQHLFGEGLVRTVDNFGVTGDTPSHPELLDYLASRFVAEGWSVKSLVKSIVLSRTYQLDSSSAEANVTLDPENRLLWRHAPRRLEAEEIRDSLLAVAGHLEPSRPQGSPAAKLPVMELRNNGAEARQIAEQWRGSRSRSVYLPLLRGLVPTALEVFDFAEQGMVTGSRDTTTVAPQALYLLNDPFVRKESLALAEGLITSQPDDAARIQEAYRLILGRSANDAELSRALAYVADYEAAARESLDSSIPEAAPTVESLVAATSETDQGGSTGETGEAKKKPAAPVNPDEMEQTDAPVKEEQIVPSDARTAAWASVVQALFGTAEFRYVQ